MIYLYGLLYLFILLMGLAAIVLGKEVKEYAIDRSPAEYILALHLGIVGLLFVAIYYLFTGRYID